MENTILDTQNVQEETLAENSVSMPEISSSYQSDNTENEQVNTIQQEDNMTRDQVSYIRDLMLTFNSFSPHRLCEQTFNKSIYQLTGEEANEFITLLEKYSPSPIFDNTDYHPELSRK